MPPAYARNFPREFPRLGNLYSRKSCGTVRYNCIAWAMSECHRPWWPGSAPDGYWPPHLPADETIDNFIAAFQTKGYEVCFGLHHENRFEKVALYVDRRGVPTHAARQSWRGTWFSKLGTNVDIAHNTLGSLEDGLYGTVVLAMKRPWTVKRFATAILLRIRTSHWLRFFCLFRFCL